MWGDIPSLHKPTQRQQRIPTLHPNHPIKYPKIPNFRAAQNKSRKLLNRNKTVIEEEVFVEAERLFEVVEGLVGEGEVQKAGRGDFGL